MIPLDLGMTIDKALEINTQFRDLYNADAEVKHLIDISKKLEGLPKSTGMHAAGVLITDEQGITQHVPVFKNKDGFVVSQYSKDYLESLGLLKMDFLGLKTMGIIQGSADRILENYGQEVNLGQLYEVPDEKPFELMAEGNTSGIFQLESPGMTDFFKKLKPTSLEDVTLGVAMYRPGPMDLIPEMLRNKHDMSRIRYEIPELANILDTTYGVMCYQEQLMQIVVEIAGYTKSDSDGFRKVVAKKKKSLIPLHRKWFTDGREIEDADEEGRMVKYRNAIPGGVKLNHPRKALERLFSQMEEFASYSFNKSHAAAYAMIAYVTAWLACYYPTEFFSVVLDYTVRSNSNKKPAKMTQYINHCRDIGIEVGEPDINHSGSYFAPKGRQILYALKCKSVKESAMKAVISRRPTEGYQSLEQFLAINYDAVDRATFLAWACVGAFRSFGYTRSTLTALTENIFGQVFTPTTKKKLLAFKEVSDRQNFIKEKLEKVGIPQLEEFPDEIILALEKEYFQHYLTGNPLDHYVNEIRECKNTQGSGFAYTYLGDFDYFIDNDTQIVSMVGNVKNNQRVKFIAIANKIDVLTTKRKEQMCRIDALDTTGIATVVVFPKAFELFRNSLEEDTVYEFRGRAKIEDDEAPCIILEDILQVSNSGNIEKCYFKVDTREEASKVCTMLHNTSKQVGLPMPTYIKVGLVTMLLPEAFWVKRSILKELSSGHYKYRYEIAT